MIYFIRKSVNFPRVQKYPYNDFLYPIEDSIAIESRSNRIDTRLIWKTDHAEEEISLLEDNGCTAEDWSTMVRGRGFL